MTPREYWTACRLHDWHYSYHQVSSHYTLAAAEKAAAKWAAEFGEIYARSKAV